MLQENRTCPNAAAPLSPHKRPTHGCWRWCMASGTDDAAAYSADPTEPVETLAGLIPDDDLASTRTQHSILEQQDVVHYPDGSTEDMSSLAFAAAPRLFADGEVPSWAQNIPEGRPPPDVPEPSAEHVEEQRAANVSAFSAPQPALQPAFHMPRSSSPFSYERTAFPGVLWRTDWRCFYGSVRTICVCAWLIFVLLPLLFFTMVRPARHTPCSSLCALCWSTRCAWTGGGGSSIVGHCREQGSTRAAARAAGDGLVAPLRSRRVGTCAASRAGTAWPASARELRRDDWLPRTVRVDCGVLPRHRERRPGRARENQAHTLRGHHDPIPPRRGVPDVTRHKPVRRASTPPPPR